MSALANDRRVIGGAGLPFFDHSFPMARRNGVVAFHRERMNDPGEQR